MEIFDRLGNVFVNKTLAKYDAKNEVEIYPLAILYALDVMCGEYLQMDSETNSQTQRYRTNCVRRTVRVWCMFVSGQLVDLGTSLASKARIKLCDSHHSTTISRRMNAAVISPSN